VRPAEQIRFLVLAAQREGNRALAAALAPLGLTPSQAEVVRVVADRAPLSLGELGALLVCESGTNPSRLVDRVVTAGLVQRAFATSDGRRLELTLTAEGRAADDAIRTIEDAIYAGINVALDGADVASTITALTALTAGSPAGEAVRARTEGA
jgi:DNA-binding MarR family transcriptional regulator